MSTVEDMASEMLLDDAFTAVTDALAEAMFNGTAASLTGPVNPAALARARRLAQTAAKSLTRQLTESQLRSMGETIARGLEAGKRPRDLYNQLQEVRALDANRARTYLKIQDYLEASDLTDAQLSARLDREYQKLLQDRRKTIAQNEGRQATSEARALEAGAAQLEMKAWTTTNAGNVCDICAGNEAAGVIPIDKPFPSGDDRTPAHPNCHCTIVYVKKGVETDILAERQQRYIEETAAAQEGDTE
jgi:hypothetical protein